MPTLYYAVGACSLAPHITLEWIGAPYEAIKVQYGSEKLLAVNPAGAVPTIREDDGWLLTQAGAILDYLAHKHPEAGLGGGDDLRAKTEAHRWSAFFTSDVHASCLIVTRRTKARKR
jgi:glutathione S-transferase